MSKKKVLFHSDFSLMKTGFGRNAKLVLTHLYNTKKYDIHHYCCGLNETYPEFDRLPWKSYGAIPADISNIDQRDPKIGRMIAYGSLKIDDMINEVKPDVYIGAQDIWGLDYTIEKKWFNKISCALWTTLDSLPILPKAIDVAKKAKNFWVWADFATKKMHEMDLKHVKTVHGVLDHNSFYKLKKEERSALRRSSLIEEDAFVVGFVFRNQLRKSVPNLLEGYKILKEKNPKVKFYLLLHTHFSEGWNIHRLADEFEIPHREILTTYTCKNCGVYDVKPFIGQDLDCDICSTQKSMTTTNVQHGTTEKQLNEIYNMMDCYCHPFTSGGQELPLQEAKLVELPVLTTNYSCGEDMCIDEAHSLPLEWSEYREHGTEFIKASTCPKSIAKRLNEVVKMSPKKREEMGKKARQWIIDNYSVEKVCADIEKFIDESPSLTNEEDYIELDQKNPDAKIDDSLDTEDWIISLYNNILDMEVDRNDKGFLYWKQELEENGKDRQAVHDYFKDVARQEITKKGVSLEDILDKDDDGKRLLYVIPESIGDIYLSTSLFKSLRDQYPDYNLYVACNLAFASVLAGNPYVHKVIPYIKQMDNLFWLEGKGQEKGYFEVALLSHFGTQRMINYTHHGKDKIAFNLKY